MRLLLSVFICIYAGSVGLGALECAGQVGRAGIKFYLIAGAALLCLGAALVFLRRAWNLENFMRRVVLSLAFFYAGVLLGAWMASMAGTSRPESPSMSQLVVTSLSFHAAALLLVGLFLREHRQSWAAAFGLSNHWRHALLLGLMSACIFLPVGWILQRASAEAMTHWPQLHLKPEEQLPVQTLRLAVSWTDRSVLGIITILLAPAAEELLFRGILYAWLRQAGFPRLALWGTALLFALMHLNAVSFVPLLILSVVLTLLYERTDNLLAPVSAHALFNGLNFVLLYWVDKQPS